MADTEQHPDVKAVARQGMADLLNRLQIKRVIFVDDVNLPEISAGSVFAALGSEPERSLQALQPHFPTTDMSPVNNEHLVAELEAHIAAMDDATKAALQAALAEVTGDADGVRDTHSLKELLPATLPFTLLTPDEWVTQKDELLGECSDKKRTLFLFDQELKGDRATHGFEHGIDIIKSLSAEHEDAFGARWFCGILSHTLQVGDEVSTWNQLAEANEIHLRFFMPISKGHLVEGTTFVDAVARTLINTYCERMKDLARAGFTKAMSTALGRFQALDPIDFEHIVAHSSTKEGVSELETLIRLYGLFHNDEVRREMLNEAVFGPFVEASAAVKAAADTMRKHDAQTHARMLKLRSSELYAPSDLINGYNDPLRNGDLFTTQEGDRYVLIGQPCDLMVRKDGERGRKGAFKIAFLAKISDGEGKLGSDLSFVLKYFGDEGTSTVNVAFSTATVANLEVLELAILRSDGACELDLSGGQKPTFKFPTKAWNKRGERIVECYDAHKVRIEKSRTDHGDAVAELIANGTIPRVGQAKDLRELGEYEAGKFVYPLSRVGRVRDPLATSLLNAFGRYLTRDAHDHDIAQQAAGSQPQPAAQ